MAGVQLRDVSFDANSRKDFFQGNIDQYLDHKIGGALPICET